MQAEFISTLNMHGKTVLCESEMMTEVGILILIPVLIFENAEGHSSFTLDT